MAKFDVAARTLIHLGSELITSDEIAIHELIKNSFDAGSTRVSINFMILFSLEFIENCRKILSVTHPIRNPIEEVTDLINQTTTPANLLPAAKEYLSFVLDKITKSSSTSSAFEIIENANFIEVIDSGSGMSRTLLNEVFLRVGTDFKVKNTSSKNKENSNNIFF